MKVYNDKGITLIELIVAMSIGAFLLIAACIFYIYSLEVLDLGHSQTYLQNESALVLDGMASCLREAVEAPTIDEYGLGDRLTVKTPDGTFQYYATVSGSDTYLYRNSEILTGKPEGYKVTNLKFILYPKDLSASPPRAYNLVGIDLALSDAEGQSSSLSIAVMLPNA